MKILAKVWVMGLAVLCLQCGSAWPADEPLGKPDKKAYKKHREEGEKALKEKRYADAKSEFQLALTEAEKFGQKDERLAQSLRELGELLNFLHEYAQAEPLLQRAVLIQNQLVGGAHLEALQARYELGKAFLGEKKLPEAYMLFADLETSLNTRMGLYDPLTALCMEGRGKILLAQGKLKEAEDVLKQAVEFADRHKQKTVMQRDPQTGAVRPVHYTYKINYELVVQLVDSLGKAQLQQKHYDDAVSSFLHLRQIAHDELSNKDKAQAYAPRMLGRIYTLKEDYQNAENFLKEALLWEEKNYGKDDPRTCDSLAGLAAVYAATHRTDEFQNTCSKAITYTEKIYGEQSLELLPPLWKMAEFYGKQGQYSQAEAFYARSIKVVTKVKGENAPELMSLLPDYAAVLRNLNRLEDAKTIEAQARKVEQAQPKPAF